MSLGDLQIPPPLQILETPTNYTIYFLQAPLCQEEILDDTGDNFIEMFLKPSLQFDEPDGKVCHKYVIITVRKFSFQNYY